MSSLLRKNHQASRTVATGLLTALLALWSPIGAFSQYGVVARGQQPQSGTSPAQQETTPSQNPITKPIAQSPEVSDIRVGVTPGEVRSLTMQDAITLALQNNLDIEQ